MGEIARAFGFISVSIVSVVVLACASSGRKWDITHTNDIRDRVHDKAQIEAWFGPPHQIAQTTPNPQGCSEQWTYVHAFASWGGAQTSAESLVVIFDAKGVVCGHASVAQRNGKNVTIPAPASSSSEQSKPLADRKSVDLNESWKTCEYVNFSISDRTLSGEMTRQSANEAILTEVERAFSRQLEEVGFHRAGPSETAWLRLDLVLQDSALARGVVTGAVDFRALPTLHREFMLALNAGVVNQQSQIGAVIAIEVATRWNRVDPTADLDGLARDKAQFAWDASTPSLAAMCAFREQLLEEGLAIEDLRQQLVDEIARARTDARQRKLLELRIEK